MSKSTFGLTPRSKPGSALFGIKSINRRHLEKPVEEAPKDTSNTDEKTLRDVAMSISELDAKYLKGKK